MNKSKGNLVLGLEAGLDGGTLSILGNEKQIDFARGTRNVSKSEDLLKLFDGLLRKNGIAKNEIGRVVVSDAPGSLTGIRIGLAMAKGLGDALGVEVRRLSILEAMAKAADREGNLVVGLSTRGNDIYFRRFVAANGRVRAAGEVMNKQGESGVISFLEEVENGEISLVVNDDLRERLYKRLFTGTEKMRGEKMIKAISENFGEILGKSEV